MEHFSRQIPRAGVSAPAEAIATLWRALLWEVDTDKVLGACLRTWGTTSGWNGHAKCTSRTWRSSSLVGGRSRCAGQLRRSGWMTQSCINRIKFNINKLWSNYCELDSDRHVVPEIFRLLVRAKVDGIRTYLTLKTDLRLEEGINMKFGTKKKYLSSEFVLLTLSDTLVETFHFKVVFIHQIFFLFLKRPQVYPRMSLFCWASFFISLHRDFSHCCAATAVLDCCRHCFLILGWPFLGPPHRENHLVCWLWSRKR